LAAGLDLVAVIAAFGELSTITAISVLSARAARNRRARAGRFARTCTRSHCRTACGTVFRILCLYLLIRQVAAALGLTSLGGPCDHGTSSDRADGEAAAQAFDRSRTRPANAFALTPRPPTMSARFSARTFSSLSVRSF
jgi:uncharacterized membrane protein